MGPGRAAYRRRPGYAIFERAAHAILNNFIVEAALVVLLGIIYLSVNALDRLLGTRLRRAYVESLQSISRDRLNFLRKAQVRHVFKKSYGLRKVRIRLAGGSYWLSIPCIVKGISKKAHAEEKYMAKIISERSAIKHNYMAMMRNLGVFAGGIGLKFDRYHCGLEMGDYERHCLERLRGIGVNAPGVYGLHKLGGDDYILVM